MKYAGFGLQGYGAVGSFDETVAKVGIAFAVSGVIFVIAVYFFEDIMVYGTIAAPNLRFSIIQCEVGPAFPVSCEIFSGRAFSQIPELGGHGPEVLLHKGTMTLQY